MRVRIEQDGDDVLVWIKAVPRASRDEIVGVLGDRLKIRTSASAEAGKANKAICRLVAGALGVSASRVTVQRGQGRPEKVLRVRGIGSCFGESDLFGQPP